MSYRIIQNILDSTLDGVTGIPNIVHENEDKDSCTNGRYLRTTILPARTDEGSVGLQGFDRFSGLYQVDFFYPTNEGSDAANYMIDQIIATFPKKTLLISGGVQLRVKNYWRGTSPTSDNQYTPNATIEWESFIQRP